jgi:hypothetical protein
MQEIVKALEIEKQKLQEEALRLKQEIASGPTISEIEEDIKRIIDEYARENGNGGGGI